MVSRLNLGCLRGQLALRGPCSRGESALYVGNNVVDVLDADGKTDIAADTPVASSSSGVSCECMVLAG